MTTQMEAVYIYGPTGRIAKKANDITEYYHTDRLGSTKLTTSEDGIPITEVRYKPFGEQINTTKERYIFNGKELDETGLYYYGARYYDAQTGRFLTRDPLTGKKEAPQTMNRYVYCLNNPLKYTDPAGTDPQDTVEEVFQRLLKSQIRRIQKNIREPRIKDVLNPVLCQILCEPLQKHRVLKTR